MSESDLPADPNRWPSDPYRLLNVPRGVSSADLKKAYLRLIRQYKPEHAPEEFRRIREAYEALSAQRPAQVFFVRADDKREARDAGKPITEFAAPTAVPASTRVSRTEDDPWELALQGDEDGAYRRLAAAAERVPVAPETFLQLYWLLTLRPELDPTRKANDWLLRGLRGPAASWQHAELLRRELTINTTEALDERVTALLRAGAFPDHVVLVAEVRWKAAAGVRRWNVILADVDALRPWLSTANESAWCRALAAAAQQLVWSDGKEREAAQALSREIDRHYHLSRELANVLARLDFAHAVATGWTALRSELGFGRFMRQNCERLVDHQRDREMARTLRRLLPLSWDAPYESYRALHRTHLRQVAAHPLQALAFFDRVRVKSIAVPGYLSTLLDVRRNAEPSACEPPDASEISDSVLDFLGAHHSWKYPVLRPAILQFCLRETAPPEALVQVVDTHPRIARAAGQELARAIEGDRVLRYVCACCTAVLE